MGTFFLEPHFACLGSKFRDKSVLAGYNLPLRTGPTLIYLHMTCVNLEECHFGREITLVFVGVGAFFLSRKDADESD